MAQVNAGVVVGGGGGGDLSKLLRALLVTFVETFASGSPNVMTAVTLNGQPPQNYSSPAEIGGTLTTSPTKVDPSPGQIIPGVNAPDYSAGSLVIDPNFTFFFVSDGGTNFLNLTPTGTVTPLAIPSLGVWGAVDPADWAVNNTGGADLSINATGGIESAAGLSYSTMWVVLFSQVPTA